MRSFLPLLGALAVSVAKEYADALIALGEEQECLDDIHRDMAAFAAILDTPDFSDNRPEVRSQAISKACEDLAMTSITTSFLGFFVGERRGVTLREVQEEFMMMYDALKNPSVCACEYRGGGGKSPQRGLLD